MGIWLDLSACACCTEALHSSHSCVREDWRHAIIIRSHSLLSLPQFLEIIISFTETMFMVLWQQVKSIVRGDPLLNCKTQNRNLLSFPHWSSGDMKSIQHLLISNVRSKSLVQVKQADVFSYEPLKTLNVYCGLYSPCSWVFPNPIMPGNGYFNFLQNNVAPVVMSSCTSRCNKLN